MKKTIPIIVMAALCLIFKAEAQKPIKWPPSKNQVLLGKVISALTGEILPGAVIKITNTSQTISSNNKGEFTLMLPHGTHNISVSYINYKVKTYLIQVPLKEQLIITLEPDDNNLKEVEIISSGYQNIPKERATGSFTQPNKEMYNNRVSTDVISKLEGITNGLVFNSPGITGNRTAKLSIRGRSTIYANDNPLIVVDNFPYDGDVNNINPNDIEDVTILKDAAASSIWGVQAGNGVIVITTKRGKINQPLKIQFNSNLTVSNKPNLFYDQSYLDASNFIDLEKYLFAQGKYDADIAQNNTALNSSTYTPYSSVVALLNKVKQSNGSFTQAQANELIDPLRSLDLRNDLSKYFYRKSINQQYNLNITGGGKQNSYYVSAGYDKNQQNVVGNSYDRITLNANNTFMPIENLELALGINYVQSNALTDNTMSQLFTGGNYSTFTPYTQLADASGNPLDVLKSYSTAFVQSASSKGFLNWNFSPLNEVENHFNTNNTKLSDARLTTGIKYTFIKGLSVEIKYLFERSINTSKLLATGDSFAARNYSNQFASLNLNGVVSQFNVPAGGILNGSISLQNSNRLRGAINFDRKFDLHAFNAIVGYETSEVKTEGNSYILYGYDDELTTSKSVNYVSLFPLNPSGGSRLTIPSSGSGSSSINRFRTHFGNASYTYNNKYTISASGRIDASNYFGVNANKKAIPLWSAGVKWDLDKENFYNLSWLSQLKFRGSYGFQGNLDKSLTAITTFQYGAATAFTNSTYATVSNYGNPDLRWEKTKMLNFGIDFTFIHNIFSGSLEYYNKKGIDLIGFTVLAPSSGITNLKGNYAGTKGKGIDLQLNSRNIDRAFKWSTSYIFNWSTDRVTEYTGTNITLNTLAGGTQIALPIIGKPVYAVYAHKTAALDPVTGDPRGYDISGNISNNYGLLNNPTSIDQLLYKGSARPIYFGGLNNRVSYKQVSIGVNVSYKFDYFIKRSGINYNNLVNRWSGNAEYANRWQKPGDEVMTNIPSFIYPVNTSRDSFYSNSEALIERGDHIRLQDASLSYDLNKAFLQKLSVNSIQFYIYANNLGILWRANKMGLDPDYPTGGIPQAKTWAFGLKASL